MFERYTDRARKVMALANESAVRHQSEYLSTEHILLGLLTEGRGAGAKVIEQLGGDLDTIRMGLERLFPVASVPVKAKRRPQTPRSKRVVACAIDEARALLHNYVGTEHLLLGLLHQPDTVAAQALAARGLTLDRARAAIIDLLYGDAAAEVVGPHIKELRELLRNPAARTDAPDVGRAFDVLLNDAGAAVVYTKSVRIELTVGALAAIEPGLVAQIRRAVADELECAASQLRKLASE